MVMWISVHYKLKNRRFSIQGPEKTSQGRNTVTKVLNVIETKNSKSYTRPSSKT